MKRLLTCGNNGRTQRIGHWTRLVLVSSAIAILFAGCTRVELESKAEAYNAAIATSTNELILLNAVRASQRAPMSFTGLGDVTAVPTFSGTASGTFNFDPFGLTTYTLNPQATVGGGFSQFPMSNLNSTDFMRKIRDDVPYKLVQYFRNHKWPQELVGIMFIRSYDIKRETYSRLLRDARARCDAAADLWMRSICDLLEEDIASMAGCPPHVERRGVITLLNTGRELCNALKFQVFLRTIVWVLRLDPFEPKSFSGDLKLRSAMDMLYYLGELIAAQNYSTRSYLPSTYVGAADIVRRAPLFVVRRGAPLPGAAAVRVSYNGDVFYIPQPELGTFEEAHSMQVLDFATQVITAQTTSTDLPKATVIPVTQVR
jgi:hypothetical protein